jgi:hypothetical protein
MKRDTVWHELFDRMTGNDCPICSLLQTRVESFMQSILYEGVNDPKIRASILQSRGFCNAHAYQLLALGDPLGHAIMYYDLIEQFGKELVEKPERDKKDKTTGSCLFCESVDQGEQVYINHFASCMSDHDFFEKYQSQGLICRHHFQAVIGNCHNHRFLICFA